MGNGNGNGSIGPNTTVRVSVLISVTIGILTGVGGLYAMRDKMLETMRAEDSALRAEITADREAHYVDKETFVEWRREFERKQDKQYYELRDAIRDVSRSLKAGR